MFGVFGGADDRRLADITKRLASIERKLDALLRHSGLHNTAEGASGSDAFELPEDVRYAADVNEKIKAIKLLREHTGMGLAEAKAAVEAYQHSRGR